MPEIGVFAGYPITASFIVSDDFTMSYSCGGAYSGNTCGTFESIGRRPLLGISVFVPVGSRLALRVTPIYQRISMGSETVVPFAPPAGPGTYSFATAANRWELPVSLRWRFTKHINAGLGATLSTLTGEGTRETIVEPAPAPGGGFGNTYTTSVHQFNFLSNRTLGGATAGIEFPFHTRIGTIAPDLEYTRWASRHYSGAWPLNAVTVGIALRFGR